MDDTRKSFYESHMRKFFLVQHTKQRKKRISVNIAKIK